MKPVELLCLFLLVKACMASEQYCRQYDYDEKLLSKMIRTEIALESLTREMKAMESALEFKLRQVTEDMTNKLQSVNSSSVKSEDLESLTQETKAMESTLESKLRQVKEDLENKLQIVNLRPVKSEGKAIGFTARDPDKSKSNNNAIIFRTIKTNVGDSFNEATGRFRCKIPGLYFFTVVILRHTGSTSQSYCYIKVNGTDTVFAYAHSKDSNEHPSGAAHLTIKLNEGDEVYLGNCIGVDRFNYNTHFSGFMIGQI